MKYVLLAAMAVFMFCGVATVRSGDGDAAKDAATTATKDRPETVRQLTGADHGTTVKIAVGEKFDVALRGNATTGYTWKVDKISGDAVAQKGDMDYVVDKHRKRMVGVGGTCIFHFEVKKAAKTKIELSYSRPWEKETSPIKTFSVTIDSSK